MKLLLAAVPAYVAANAGDLLNAYCATSGDESDITACQGLADGYPSILTDIDYCNDRYMADEREGCFRSAVDKARGAMDGDNNYASTEFAMNEFLSNIGDDPMLQSVLSELNGLTAYLEANQATRRMCIEDELPEGETCADQEAAAEEASGDQIETADSLKRFVELKQMVSWMQPKDKRISRYCFYGCWCLPEGAHSFVAGEGRPVDLVDKACQYLWFCYTCAKQEFRGVFGGRAKECTPDRQKYSFRFRYDKSHPAHYDKRDIICKDNFYNPMNNKEKWKSNCARAICECDRGLSMRLYRSWKHWDKSRHRIWSQKVTSCKQLDDCDLLPDSTDAQKAEKAACVKRGCLFIVKRRCLNGDTGDSFVDHDLICCGVFEDEGGRIEMRDHGGTHACCNHDVGTGNGDGFPWNGNWYNTISHCCLNGKVIPAGGSCPI